MVLSHENANDVKPNVHDSDVAHPQCSCPSGTSGNHCEKFTPCLKETTEKFCPHYDKYILLENDSYRCLCHKNAILSKQTKFVSIKIVTCFVVNGECSEHNGNANCECDQGFEGESCELKVDVCEKIGDVCGRNGKCVSNSADGTWK